MNEWQVVTSMRVNNYFEPDPDFKAALVEAIESNGGFLALEDPVECNPMESQSGLLVHGDTSWCWYVNGPEDFGDKMRSSNFDLHFVRKSDTISI